MELISEDIKLRILGLNQQLEDLLFILSSRDKVAPTGRINPLQERQLQIISNELESALANTQQVLEIIEPDNLENLSQDESTALQELISVCLINEQRFAELNSKFF